VAADGRGGRQGGHEALRPGVNPFLLLKNIFGANAFISPFNTQTMQIM
jgi:hypothetical protein